ncbi:MAG: hypothetical protein MUE47_07640 [Acidobacteria bacterium]|nr:hypothetical protein [Acidobacteriota bacterium]
MKRFVPRDSLIERLVCFGGLSVALAAVGLYQIPFWARWLGPAPLVEMTISTDPRYLVFAFLMNPAGMAASAGLAWLFSEFEAPPIFILVLLAVYAVIAYLWWLGIARACGFVAGLLRRS